jgi:hypothetical protein
MTDKKTHQRGEEVKPLSPPVFFQSTRISYHTYHSGHIPWKTGVRGSRDYDTSHLRYQPNNPQTRTVAGL